MEHDFLMVRISPDLKRRLKERAEVEHRDMTKHVIHLIEKDLQTAQVPTTTPTPEPQQ